jgi:hypothetical protein
MSECVGLWVFCTSVREGEGGGDGCVLVCGWVCFVLVV